jgi:hypothetical protein
MGGPGAVNDDSWADVIGTFSMYPEVSRNVLRLLAEIDAANHSSGVHRPRCPWVLCKKGCKP